MFNNTAVRKPIIAALYAPYNKRPQTHRNTEQNNTTEAGSGHTMAVSPLHTFDQSRRENTHKEHTTRKDLYDI